MIDNRNKINIPDAAASSSLPYVLSTDGFTPTNAFDIYWYFAFERQNIFFSRIDQQEAPWTNDAILRQYRFTNAYRASDRVSQYLIRNVQYAGSQEAEELFFRTLLFKIFNKIGTWQLLETELGQITWETYDFRAYDDVLTRAMEAKQKIFSAAYIMPSGGQKSEFSRKHRNYLKLLEDMMRDRLPRQISKTPSMRSAFELIRSYPMLGDFLAYQYVIDLNYSTLTDFSESEFVVAGPGAHDGISKCLLGASADDSRRIISLFKNSQAREFERLNLNFHSLWGRPLQLIDCQNIFCEVSKYTRVSHPELKGRSGRTRIKQSYGHSEATIIPWYPPKWGINHLIEAVDARL